MENNEKYIIRRLRDHREEIDMDELWAGVSPNIPKEKKRRRIGFWIFGGLVVGLMMISIAWKVNSSIKLENEQFSGIEKLNITHAEKVKNNEEFTSPSLEELNTIAEIDEKKKSTTQILGSDVYASLNPITKDIQNEETIQDINSRINEISIERYPTIDESGRKIYNEFEDKSTLANSKINSEKNYSIAKIHHKGKKTIPQEREFVKTNSLQKINMDLLQSRRDQEIPILEIELRKIEISTNNINKWSTYLIGGGAVVNRKLSHKSIELKNESDRRESVVNVLGGWEIEGGIGFRLSPKLKIMTGLNYSQIHEKALFNSDYLVDFEMQTENLIHNQDGSVINETSTSNRQGERHTDEIRYNQLKILQIPVRLTYEFLALDKFKLNIGAMASYSIRQRYTGFTSFSASTESYDLDIDKENKFRTSGAASYGVFIEGTTHLSEMLDLSISLGYKQTKRINSEIYLIDQQYNSISFTSGLIRRF